MTKTLTPDPRDDGFDSLSSLLRSLRFREMADELPDLLDQAGKNGWGQLDLLNELFRREEVRRLKRRFERNLKASGLSECYGLEHFDFDLAQDHGVASKIVRDLAQCEFIRARRNLVLAGGIGTGKTYLARTLGVEALKHSFRVLSFNTANLLDLLYSKRDSFHFGRLYSRIRDVDLLLLDDLAYMKYSAEKVEYLFSLIVDRRSQTGSIIVTSNTDVTEWWQYFPSKAMGMAFSDRLLDGAQGIWFTGESIRKPRNKRFYRGRDKNGEGPPGKENPPEKK